MIKLQQDSNLANQRRNELGSIEESLQNFIQNCEVRLVLGKLSLVK